MGQILITARSELQGNPLLTFSDAGNTITRDEGSWLDDGFETGQTIRLSGSSNNDDETYTVLAVDDDLLTLSSLIAETASRDIEVIGTATFTVTTTALDTARTELGFGASQTADSADLVITISDESVEPYRVTLDGAITIKDVIDAIEAQTGGNVRAEIDPDTNSGLRLTQVPALTDNPRLSFYNDHPDPAYGETIVREDGKQWAEDQFAIGQTVRVSGADEDNDGVYTIDNIVDIGGKNALIVSSGTGTISTDQQSVKDIRITLAGNEIFRIEVANGSKAAVKLGILKADVSTDVDESGKVDVNDSDGIINGDSIAGASILDRFFIQDPKVEGNVFIRAGDSATDGIQVVGDFGFVSIELNGYGAFDTTLTLDLDDPTPDVRQSIHPPKNTI